MPSNLHKFRSDKQLLLAARAASTEPLKIEGCGNPLRALVPFRKVNRDRSPSP
jgi:hypothetical protein